MNKLFLLFLIIIFNCIPINAQNLEIQIIGATNKAYLYQLSGEKTTLIDSVSTNKGIYRLSLSDKNKKSIYRLTFDKNKSLDFVNDGEDVSIKTNSNNVLDSLQVITSESNKLYYYFIKLNKQYKTKSELLQLILSRYPQDDEYYITTQNKLSELQKEYSEFINITSQKKPNSFISRYIISAQLPIVDDNIPIEKHLSYLKSHSLDNVDFTDAELINSDVFSNKSIEYLTYYRNPQLPKELLEKEFMIAVDTLLNKAKVNTEVYKHIVEYLLDGFKKFGFDAIINYIIENYVIKDDICIDQKLETALQRRLDQVKYFKLGDFVPNIVIEDIELNKIKSDKVLILFYASWCHHCQTLLPQIYELYKNQKEKKTEVLAISIDTIKTDWQNYINSNELHWINVSDLRGWNGKVALDYFIYATPTTFLIDKNRKIIAKPLSIDELIKYF